MKNFLIILCLLLSYSQFSIASTNPATLDTQPSTTTPPVSDTQQGSAFTQAEQQAITPQQALELLKQGNHRFVDNKMLNFDYPKIRNETAASQYPFAVVLSCLDSRSSPDITFDQGIGNIFIGRVAGNVIDNDLLGSMEFATNLVGSKLIVVLGHTSCGAVQGSCAGGAEGHLKSLLSKITPAVKMTQKQSEGSCTNINFVNTIAKQNVINQVQAIYQDSPVIHKLVNEKKVLLVGAMHDLATGKVDFFYEFKPSLDS